MTAPPFVYYGGKVGMARRIIELFPPHDVYLEPFFGSGAVLFAKEPSAHEIVNDIDGDIVNFFEVLRSSPGDLEEMCRLTPYARDEWRAAVLDGAPDPLERARRFWVRINQSFAKTHNSHTGWSITTARTQSPPKSVLTRIGRFRAAAERLMLVTIENTDALGLLDRFATHGRVVVYADPPYLASTRRGAGSKRLMDDYRHEMTEENHVALAARLHRLDAVVVLSGYPSGLYDDLYADWWHVDHHVSVHSSNALKTTRAGRVERIWVNQEPGHQLPFGAATTTTVH